MTELKRAATHENDLSQSFLYYIICNLSYLRAQNLFPNKSYSVNKTNFAHNFMNFVVNATVFAIGFGILFFHSLAQIKFSDWFKLCKFLFW